MGKGSAPRCPAGGTFRFGDLIFWMIAVALSGCGYRPLLTKTSGVETIHVAYVKNSTSYRDIAAPLTTLLRRDLRRVGVSVAPAGSETWVLRVAVVDIRQEIAVIRREATRELPAEVTWQIQTLVTVIAPDGQRTVNAVRVAESLAVPVSGPVMQELTLADHARSVLLERISRRIAMMIFEL